MSAPSRSVRLAFVALSSAALVPACAFWAVSDGPPSPSPPRTESADRSVAAGASIDPVRTVTVFEPEEAGLTIETVEVGPRRHTVVRTIAGVAFEHRSEGDDWFVRVGHAAAGVPTDRWIHIDLAELRDAGVEAPPSLTEQMDDAGFVFELREGQEWSGLAVTQVASSEDGAEVTVTFGSGLRARGRRAAAPAGTVIDLPTGDDVIPLRDLPALVGR